MKTRKFAKTLRAVASVFLTAFFLNVGLCQAQSPSTSGPSAAANAHFTVFQRGPHARVWRNAAGQSVTEIGTGMNYWDGQQWTQSDPSFVVSPDGTAFVASHIQDPTSLAANLNCVGAVTVTTPDNVTLRSTPIAIGLYDAASGKSVVVATLTNTTGVLADAQHVVYDKAFVGGGFAASVVYSLPDTGSFHQDIVFTGFNTNFDPTVWGFAANSTNTLQVQILTEFYDSPQPHMVARPVYIEADPATRASMASPDLIDQSIDFGDYVFWPGQAYIKNNPNAGARILKDFVTASGRTFLVESIPYRWVADLLETLPPVVAKNDAHKPPTARRTRVAAAFVPALRRSATASIQKIPKGNAALAVALPQGVTADYVVTVSPSSPPVVYSADTTYYVSSTVWDYAPVTLESAVFKFPINAGIIYIDNNGELTLGTTNYRPAIFTAADDNTVGTALSTNIWSGYTGHPATNSYGVTALWLYAATNVSLNNLQFRYQYNGVAAGYAGTNTVVTVSHCQFVDGVNGIIFEPYPPLTLNLNNCLIGNVEYQVQSHGFPLTLNACDCTFDQALRLFCGSGPWSGTASYNITNSILSNITNEFLFQSGSTYVTNAACNGFYNAVSFGASSMTNSTSPYQAVGAGNYYLPSSSPFLTLGTTNIGAALLSQLQEKTVIAPLVLTNLFTNNTILMPVVQRDTVGTALGFHEDPIDYLAACSVSNATLFLTNGVALAYYDNLGIWLQDGSQLVSQGTPNYRNYLAYYSLVQEEPLSLATNTLAQSMPIAPSPFASSDEPSVFLRLTTICAPQGETNLLNTGDFGKTGQVISGLTLRDCEIYGSGANWLMSESNNEPVVGLTNNVFYRVPFAISNNATIVADNNLFYGTTNTNGFTVSIRHLSGTSPNTNENNVFDGVTASLDGTVGYNAYLNGGTNTTIQASDIAANLVWQRGPLGAYYQTSNSPLLTNGSTYATNLGLYHYTVGTNEVVEGTNIVSRGYHYVAVGTNGLPLDTNGDGIPDYLEDANGNGVVDSGEIDWLVAGDLGLSVTITQPANNSQIP